MRSFHTLGYFGVSSRMIAQYIYMVPRVSFTVPLERSNDEWSPKVKFAIMAMFGSCDRSPQQKSELVGRFAYRTCLAHIAF